MLDSQCGLYLGNCSDDREYNCMTNVIKLSDKDKKVEDKPMNKDINLRFLVIQPQSPALFLEVPFHGI